MLKRHNFIKNYRDLILISFQSLQSHNRRNKSYVRRLLMKVKKTDLEVEPQYKRTKQSAGSPHDHSEKENKKKGKKKEVGVPELRPIKTFFETNRTTSLEETLEEKMAARQGL